jgi:GNAT superfamily N-acetyltransferase/RimJ/RimL family protein N-acetyltransferase
VLIRETTAEDLPRIDAVTRAVEPWHVATVETQRRAFESTLPQACELRLHAEIDDEIVGVAMGGLDVAVAAGGAYLRVRVLPAARGAGIGTALHERTESHLRSVGATLIRTFAMDDPASIAFGEHRGYTRGATNLYVVVDPHDLPAAPPVPAGVHVLSAREAGPEPFFLVSDEAARDEPGDMPYEGMAYADWLAVYWPIVDPDMSMLAVVDGVPAATTALNSNYVTGRAMSIGSDNRRQFRGQGLVKLIKSMSLRAAAARGVTAAFTSNNEVNAPIRAINAWLGYRPVGAVHSMVRHF